MATDFELSLVWTRLPFDIICVIINATDEEQTLQNWCIATLGNRLCKAASARRWWSLDINILNLPVDLVRKGKKKKPTPLHVLQRNGLGKALIEHDKYFDFLPAPFLKYLRLGFQQSDQLDDKLCNYTLSLKQVNHGLLLLLRAATRLELIEQWGPLHQTWLESIVKQCYCTCHSLSLRYGDLEAP